MLAFRASFTCSMSGNAEPGVRLPEDPTVGSIRQAVDAKDFNAVNKRVMHRIVGSDRNPYKVSPGFGAAAIGLMMVGAVGYGASLYIRVAKPFAANARVTRTAAEAAAAHAQASGTLGPLRLAETRQLVQRWQYLRARHAARNPHLYVEDAHRAGGEHMWMTGEGGGLAGRPRQGGDDSVAAADALQGVDLASPPPPSRRA